ncbi:MAG: AAC(3) family N-acetyltransferase [Planctomycetota bacterium]
MSGKTVVTKQDIIKGLKDMGLKAGNSVLVHSSLSSFGYVDGGADTVIDALLETVGKEGTVIVPTLTGSPQLSCKNPPVFDVCNSPCWTGRIPETFRKRTEAIRSLHPTHSVAAIGAKATYFTEGHENCVTPCGENSPYHKLMKSGGYVLFIGVGLGNCTLMHTIEELAGLDYVLQDGWVNASIRDSRGNSIQRKLRIHKYGNQRNFPKMESILLERGVMKKNKIGDSAVSLVSTSELFETVMEKLENSPNFLLNSTQSIGVNKV